MARKDVEFDDEYVFLCEFTFIRGLVRKAGSLV